MAVGAALGWASYYLFVLWGSPTTAPSAVLCFPFLFGGLAFAVYAGARGEGRAFLAAWRSPAAYGRTGLMVGMQAAVLASTYLTGPVDASLLSLLGDLVAIPLVAAAWFVGPRQDLRRPRFVAGLLLSLAGGSLAIVGGRHLAAVPPLGWVAVVGVPATVAVYFILSAQAADGTPPSAVVGQSILGAAIGTALLAPWVPGGVHGLVALGPRELALVAANGTISFFLAPLLYFGAVGREGIVVPSMLMTGIPIFTLLLSVGVLGEAVPGIAVLGIPLAVVGAVVSLRVAGTEAGGAARWARARR